MGPIQRYPVDEDGFINYDEELFSIYTVVFSHLPPYKESHYETLLQYQLEDGTFYVSKEPKKGFLLIWRKTTTRYTCIASIESYESLLNRKNPICIAILDHSFINSNAESISAQIPNTSFYIDLTPNIGQISVNNDNEIILHALGEKWYMEHLSPSNKCYIHTINTLHNYQEYDPMMPILTKIALNGAELNECSTFREANGSLCVSGRAITYYRSKYIRYTSDKLQYWLPEDVYLTHVKCIV